MVRTSLMRLTDIVAVLLVLLLTACASSPNFSTEGVNETATPRQAVAEIESLRNDAVLWGGIIVNSTNLKHSTRLEVLGYPLDNAQRPDTSAQPTGRFLAIEQGYLETADYRQGRLVTVEGTLTETRKGTIGEADYTYPALKSNQLYLWPEKEQAVDRTPAVNFGFGIGIGF
jgi:outer membrane lipoprotein